MMRRVFIASGGVRLAASVMATKSIYLIFLAMVTRFTGAFPSDSIGKVHSDERRKQGRIEEAR